MFVLILIVWSSCTIWAFYLISIQWHKFLYPILDIGYVNWNIYNVTRYFKSLLCCSPNLWYDPFHFKHKCCFFINIHNNIMRSPEDAWLGKAVGTSGKPAPNWFSCCLQLPLYLRQPLHDKEFLFALIAKTPSVL